VLRQDPALEIGGERLRGYRLLERIGEGAFGTVHRAFQPEVGREVAVKVIGQRTADHPEFIRRFGVEAQLVARLEHPHIVPLYDYWREPDGAYLVMRYLRGGNLREALAGGPLDAERTLRLTDQLAPALATAHRQGVIHRDVKPANILFDEDGNAYLSDFGIARDLTGGDARRAPSPAGPYRSPEAVRGEPLTTQADVYGLGVVVAECLTGSPDGSAMSPTVREVVARATAAEPTERFASVMDFAEALRRTLSSESGVVPAVAEDLRNPYKGLHAFQEADAGDFFGRESSAGEVAAMLAGDEPEHRLVAVVGPSGSGKSSLVRAGLIPELRAGALPGSAGWYVVEMVPGSHPFDELADGLTRISVDPAPGLARRLRDPGGLARAADEVLPDERSELLLVIDQFEEVFSLVAEEDERAAFLDSLTAAVTDPGSRVRVVLTLRGDFYDRPLQYRGFGELVGARTYPVTPLSTEQLQRAVAGPAEAVGARIEPGLLTEVVAEVAGRPGALPLLQYALTEVFEERAGTDLTLDALRAVGGVSGALARRAEALYARLGPKSREATRQLFLRLVAVGEDGSERTRRRVLRAELASLDLDGAGLDAAIDAFGSRRLLTFDRDPVTRGPTVEIAHEALLREWVRLRDWIDESEEQLRLHGRIAAAAGEWAEAGRSDDYLLSGDRLEQAEEGLRRGSVVPTASERDYLAASRARAAAGAAAEQERRAREARLERRSVTRLRSLVVVLAVASLVAASLTVVAVSRSREAERQRSDAILLAARERAGRLTAAAVETIDIDPQLSLVFGLHAAQLMRSYGQPVPSETVEVLHWGLQEAGVEYPMRDGPALEVNGPTGIRGLFDMPAADLANLAMASTDRSLSIAQCEQYFGSPTCPSLPRTFPPNLAAEPVDSNHVTFAQPLQGTTVTLHSGLDTTPAFRKELNQFTARTGIRIRLVGNPAIGDYIESSVRAGDPPDLAFLPSPDAVAFFAHEIRASSAGSNVRRLMDLGRYLDIAELRREQSPYLVSLGTLNDDGTWPSSDGMTAGAFVQLTVKSLVWYPVPEFDAAGYDVPATWDDLVALSDRMVGDGRTPWCLGWGAENATGWPGTDWIENLVLTGAGAAAYDRWTVHDLPFESPEVREAFERLGRILFTKGFVDGGPAAAARRPFEQAQTRMVNGDPPRCWLYQFPGFASNFIPPGSLGNRTAFFPFPRTTAESTPGMLGAGIQVGAFSDRPEVREVVRFLVGPDFGRLMVQGNGAMSPNRGFDVANYPPVWRSTAEELKAALAADSFRFDASDLMPPEIGEDLFWKAMVTYATEGPDSLDGILAQLDAAWPDASG
jgi:ABC-type glycerol-3-phosphate transport system substrate-binding protein